MKLSVFSTALFTIAVSGCSAPIDFPESADARPGQNLVSPSAAGSLFAEVCLRTAPSFQTALQVISDAPYVKNSETDVYYHKFDNLSFKVGEYGCSMVFRSDLSIDQTLSGMANGTVQVANRWNIEVPRNIDVTSRPSADGNGRLYTIGLPR